MKRCKSRVSKARKFCINASGRGMVSNVLWMVAGLSFLALVGCNNEFGKYIELNRYIIDKNTKTNKVVFLSDFFSARLSAKVCVLYPYQDEVSGEFQESRQVNNYLRKIEYFPNDMYSIIVFDDELGGEGRIRVFRIWNGVDWRAQVLELVPGDQVQERYHVVFPSNFSSRNCALMTSAAFYRGQFANHDYLIFGEAYNVQF